MKVSYVIAGCVTQEGKLVRGVAIVDVEAETEFDRELKALRHLPIEALSRRGQQAAEAWPLDSQRGTELALAAGLVQPVPALQA